MAKIYYEKDADLKYLEGKKVGVLGYGSQGRAHALNLKDSGVEVLVSELEGTSNYKQAEEDGFSPKSISDVTKEADVLMVLVQDNLQPIVYKNCIEPNLKEGKALGFAHGFSILFNQVVPPKNVDVFMVAPKGPGDLLRDQFEQGNGVPCLVAVEQDFTGNALGVALAYAKGLGGTRCGVVETTFKEETETDLFGEQAVLCGGVTALMKAGFEVLVEAGYEPESAYFECIHEMKLIIDLVNESGFAGMRYSISNTAEYGDYITGPKIITEETKNAMRKVLSDIQDGTFARNWLLENQIGCTNFNAKRRIEADHPLEKVGAEFRNMMSWTI